PLRDDRDDRDDRGEGFGPTTNEVYSSRLIERPAIGLSVTTPRRSLPALGPHSFPTSRWCGSSASRRPSPRKFTQRTVMRMARPGNHTSHGARVVNCRLPFSRLPHVGVGGCTPNPRKESADSVRMAAATESVALTMIGPM